ncbi:Cytochrome P450 [Pseudonocardia thermophila]|uniref:Cytochrome P450 n=1 Tax=Pseudonocardia thermophila TaxID=1848 RepID=A0A1M6XY00_PSETH|nr:cytochrome P450 [Pseudonocardia thermophila]SHL10850.1 Cytochrome P450 [Pseudonocardia thermophila]
MAPSIPQSAPPSTPPSTPRSAPQRTHRLVTASPADTVRVLALAVAPIVAQGVIARRRRVVGLAGKLDTDGRGVRELQRLRARYGTGPIRLRVPLRPVALVLDPGDVRTVLTGTPGPYTPRNREKRGALGRFQPHGVLVSRDEQRPARRRAVEELLDGGHPVHRFGDAFTRVAREETTALLAAARGTGEFGWDEFVPAWWRIVRRIVLGDAARDDHTLTDDLTVLRHAANWSGLGRRHRRRSARLRAGLEHYAAAAEPGSLAALVAAYPDEAADPVGQIPHWLFAFDAGAAVTLRALALLVAHPGDTDLRAAALTAAVLESARLWPTTPLVLRDTTRRTTLGGGELRAHTAMLIPAWFHHRDDEVRADADRFDPQQWLDGTARADWTLMPFSAGPAACPGRELVLLVARTVLETLLTGADVSAGAGVPDSGAPLPRGLDPFALTFRVRPPE